MLDRFIKKKSEITMIFMWTFFLYMTYMHKYMYI